MKFKTYLIALLLTFLSGCGDNVSTLDEKLTDTKAKLQGYYLLIYQGGCFGIDSAKPEKRVVYKFYNGNYSIFQNDTVIFSNTYQVLKNTDYSHFSQEFILRFYGMPNRIEENGEEKIIDYSDNYFIIENEYLFLSNYIIDKCLKKIE